MNKSIIDSMTYILSNAINSAIPFILLPVLIYLLPAEEYGKVAIFQTFTFGLFSLVGLNCYMAANRAYFDQASQEYKVRFNTACVQLPLIASSFIAIVFFLAYSFFEGNYIISESMAGLALLSSLSLNFIYLRLGQWQVREQPRKFVKFFLVKLVIELLISVLLVLNLRSAEGRIYAIVIINLLFSLLSIFLLSKDLLISKNLFSFDRVASKEVIKFGVPLIPHFLGIVLLTSIDRVVILKYMTFKDVGVYMVAMQISNGFLLIFDGINKVVMPAFSQKLTEESDKQNKIVIKTIYKSLTILGLISVVLWFLVPELSSVLSRGEYEKVTAVIGILVLAQCIGGGAILLSNLVLYYKDTSLLSVITVICGVVHVILSIGVIGEYGLQGVAVSFLISKTIGLILMGLLVIYRYSLPWLYFLKVK